MSTKKPGKPGRPRDESLRVRILDTAVTILVRRGYHRATMNEIALSAQVGKQTLYRWWRNRAELLMEALLYNAEKNVDALAGNGENDTLKDFITRIFDTVNRDAGTILRSLVAESIADKKFARVFFTTFIARRQQALARTIIGQSPAHGMDPDTLDTLVDIIFGAMWYRIIFAHRPLDEKLASFLSDIALRKE